MHMYWPNTNNNALCGDEIRATKLELWNCRAAQLTSVLLFFLCPTITRCDVVSLMGITVIPLCWYILYPASVPLTLQCIRNEEFTTEHLKIACVDSATVMFLGWWENTPIIYNEHTSSYNYTVRSTYLPSRQRGLEVYIHRSGKGISTESFWTPLGRVQARPLSTTRTNSALPWAFLLARALTVHDILYTHIHLVLSTCTRQYREITQIQEHA